MSEELPLLLARYRKEIWEWKQKESQWIKDQNQLEGHKRIVDELSAKVIELGKRLAEALEVDEAHQKLNGKLQERLTEVEEDNKKLAKQIQDLSKSKQPF